MNFTSELIKKLSPFMKSKGFTKSRGDFYYIAESIAYCVSFSMPTGLLYVTVYVMPLYLPCQSRYLSYGNRLNYIRNIELPLLTKESDSATIDAWCQSFCEIIDKKVLPFFQKIGTPNKLLMYSEDCRDDLLTSYISCDLVAFWRLKMFTQVYTGELTAAVHTIAKYRSVLCEVTFLADRIIQKYMEEADVVESLIHNEEAAKAFCLEIITKTQQLFS